MNDPNGLVYAGGVYHLFFQQNPAQPRMGAIHWGHATSRDLVHWKQQPTALFPDRLGYIFSGSAVLDTHNTSGLGRAGHAPLVALFTNHDPHLERLGGKSFENQSLAYSLDNGKTWTKYAENPVLKNPGVKDFRDPKVMWYAPAHTWIMALAVRDHIAFYSSRNLRDWKAESEFGRGRGAHGGVWECPDLIALDNGGRRQWVLLVSINPGGPNGGSATQYFVGDFDGKTFTSGQKDTRWIDFGPDDYAGVTWSNTNARQIFLGWMNNWQYGQQVPTHPWRGAMTVPRDLGLRTIEGRTWIVSQPVPELDRLAKHSLTLHNVVVRKTLDLSTRVGDRSGRFRLALSVPHLADWSLVLSNAQGERMIVGYDKRRNQYYTDRTHAGNTHFAPGFARVHIAPRIATGSRQEMTLLVDTASVELFADDGLSCLTATFFPHEPFTQAALQAPHGLTLQTLRYASLHSIWK